jgi:hypothetical protein
MNEPEEHHARLTREQAKRRRTRSIVLALVLAALAAIFYVLTIVKFGPGVLDRPL